MVSYRIATRIEEEWVRLEFFTTGENYRNINLISCCLQLSIPKRVRGTQPKGPNLVRVTNSRAISNFPTWEKANILLGYVRQGNFWLCPYITEYKGEMTAYLINVGSSWGKSDLRESFGLNWLTILNYACNHK